MESAQRELLRGVRGMLGRTLRVESALPQEARHRTCGSANCRPAPGRLLADHRSRGGVSYTW